MSLPIASLLVLFAAAPVQSDTSLARIVDASPADVVRTAERIDAPVLADLLLAQTDVKAEGLYPELRSQVVLSRARAALADGHPDEALKLLVEVPSSSEHHASARYLWGVARISGTKPSADDQQQALAAFEEAAARAGRTQEDRSPLRSLALLARARTLYALGRADEAAKAYLALPRDFADWPQSLLELAYARRRANDWGGALGAVENLRAPQLAKAWVPEAPMLRAILFHEQCLTREARASVDGFEAASRPALRTLNEVLDATPVPKDAEWVGVLERVAPRLPAPLVSWINRGRVGALADLATRVASETRRSAGGPASLDSLQHTVDGAHGRAILERLQAARADLRRLADQVDVVRFESAKLEKELAEAAVDQPTLLGGQRLRRPRAPGESYESWAFDGEYWADEVGHYRAELKRGCPKSAVAEPRR